MAENSSICTRSKSKIVLPAHCIFHIAGANINRPLDNNDFSYSITNKISIAQIYCCRRAKRGDNSLHWGKSPTFHYFILRYYIDRRVQKVAILCGVLIHNTKVQKVAILCGVFIPKYKGQKVAILCGVLLHRH